MQLIERIDQWNKLKSTFRNRNIFQFASRFQFIELNLFKGRRSAFIQCCLPISRSNSKKGKCCYIKVLTVAFYPGTYQTNMRWKLDYFRLKEQIMFQWDLLQNHEGNEYWLELVYFEILIAIIVVLFKKIVIA